MKYIYPLIALCASLLCALNATAVEFTLEWDTPGSIMIQTESNAGPYEELGADQTSYTFSNTKSYGYCYVYATSGYRLTGAGSADGTLTYSPQYLTVLNKWYIIGYVDSKCNGRTIHIDAVPMERNESFTINLENGQGCVNATFKGDYKLNLEAGVHSYAFNQEIDNPLSLSFTNGVTAPYKVTLDGTDISDYSNIDITAGSTLDIRTFENDSDAPTPCTISFEYAAGLEGCITNIRDWTNATYIYPADITGNTLTVMSDTDLQINLNADDYTYTAVLVNGQNMLSTFSGDFARFKVSEPNTVIRIEGTPIQVNMVTFTGYIVNGEGLEVRNTYAGDPFDLPAGVPIDEDIIIDNVVFPAASTLKYEISVPSKQNKFFFGPLKGWCITNVYTKIDGTISGHGGSASIYAPSDGTTFYMILNKLPAEYSADVIIETGETDSFYLMMRGSSTLDDMWGNPQGTSYNTNVAEQTISFIPGYDTPITLRAFGDEGKAPGVYLDGVAVTQGKDPNSEAPQFLIEPYYPESESDLQVKSQIVIYNSAVKRPSMTGAVLELEGGAEATLYYSDVMHRANPAGQAVIKGTSFTVVPASPDLTVYYKNELVKLDADGKYTFIPTGNARENIVKVTTEPAPAAVEITESSDNITIYSIDGRLVLQTTDSAAVNSLEPGLYIINGRKVLISNAR